MRKFDETIFFGCEDCLEKCYILHRRLEEAFNILGGLQQPDHSDSEEIAKQAEQVRLELEEDLADIGIDIITALGLSEEILKVLSKKKVNKTEMKLFEAAKQYAVDNNIEEKEQLSLDNLGNAGLDYAYSVKSSYDKKDNNK